MKTLSFILAILFFAPAVHAKTYTIGSGNWPDSLLWGGEYIGSTIKAGDIVVITGHITLTTPLFVEGTIQVEGGGALEGMQDITILNGGVFENKGNTVVRRVINEGVLINNLMLQAMTGIENKCAMVNYNTLISGINVECRGGDVFGGDGKPVITYTLVSSDETDFEIAVAVFCNTKVENLRRYAPHHPIGGSEIAVQL